MHTIHQGKARAQLLNVLKKNKFSEVENDHDSSCMSCYNYKWLLEHIMLVSNRRFM